MKLLAQKPNEEDQIRFELEQDYKDVNIRAHLPNGEDIIIGWFELIGGDDGKLTTRLALSTSVSDYQDLFSVKNKVIETAVY